MGGRIPGVRVGQGEAPPEPLKIATKPARKYWHQGLIVSEAGHVGFRTSSTRDAWLATARRHGHQVEACEGPWGFGFRPAAGSTKGQE